MDEAEFAHGLRDEVVKNLGAEKAQGVRNQAAIARQMQAEGSVSMDGMGQKVASVDARTFFRWDQQYPGCWRNKEFVREFLRDNPGCRAPGYTGFKR